ncbi:MAG: cardiolipin synthase [Tissierellia bacterium]|nr:cardiolipin synthase [Tissierellia bacterium]
MLLYLKISSSLIWINIFLAILIIFFGRKNPKSTLMWVMVLTFLPGIGFIFYLLFGQDMRARKMFELKEEQDQFIKGISFIQWDYINSGRYHYSNVESKRYNDLIQMNLALDESFYTEDNDIKIYNSGEEKFEDLIKDIRNAKKRIDFQYYILKPDNIGLKIIHELEKKLDEGVEVRILYDCLGGRYLRKKHFKTFKEKGGKVAVFFKSIIPFFNIRINYRNHRKIVVIDNKIGYVGGFNIGDEYLGKDKKFGPWRDTHLRMVGTSVLGLKLRFMKDWHYASKEPIGELKSFKIPINTNGKSGVQVLTSGPDTTNPNIKNVIFKMINDAKKEIFIQTPYFIPDDSVMEAIKTAILSGVEVNLMVPSFGDHPLVYWANLSYIGELLKLGANIYHYNNGFLHSKVVIVDDYISTVGSANIDNRSFYLNFEVNAVIYDFDKNKELKDQFYKDIEVSNKYTLEEYNNRTRMTKIKESVSKLFSPIL